MTYYERRYSMKLGGGSVDTLGREGGVLCDRCGFGKHFRATLEDDGMAARLDDELEGWTWDPQGAWCWDRCWSMGFHPCDECGRNANEQVPLDIIADELRQLEAA